MGGSSRTPERENLACASVSSTLPGLALGCDGAGPCPAFFAALAAGAREGTARQGTGKNGLCLTGSPNRSADLVPCGQRGGTCFYFASRAAVSGEKITVTVLLTTGTVTAARLLQQRLTHPRLVHQFVPLDVPRWGRRFLANWQPQAVVFTESELWPNLIGLCHQQNIPVALVNGRMSERSFKNWRRFRPVTRRMLERFAWIAARSDADAQHFQQLGARSLAITGDLKTAAPPLPVDQVALQSVQQQLAGRPVFLAASTHEGEEYALRPVLQILQARFPSLLTIIVPRHPERGAAISALFGGAPRRAQGQVPARTDAVWVCDTLGELGLFYRLADFAFIGNSLPDVRTGGGGHNPFEPARLGCALATGPRIQNFQEAFAILGESVVTVSTAADLVDWVSAMLENPARRKACAEQAQAVATANMALPEQLADKILALLPA